MDFDHRNRETKSFRVTAGRAMLMSTERLLAEVAKCDIVCANCHRVRTRDVEVGRTRSEASQSRLQVLKTRKWREQAALLNRLRGVPCADCGERYPACAMDFDHRDPVTKLSAVTRMVGRATTEAILAEAAKCDIVCANCHRVRTNATHSTARE
jgi:hypothetical protein